MTININALKQKLNNKPTETATNHFPVFSFSKLNPGDTIPIRLLEDGDKTNTDSFWVQRHTRTLQFNSVLLPDGSVLNNKVYVTVPAFNLKGSETRLDNLPDEYLFKSDEDVIQQEIKPLYVQSDSNSQQLYKKFQKKVNFVYQGFVRAPGYETKLYRFIFSKAVHDLIFDGCARLVNELDVDPTNQENGYDFILNVKEKTVAQNGRSVKMKDYSSSSFSLKSSPLTEAEKEYLANHPLFSLKDYIFRKPTQEQLEIMLEMFRASFNEEPYDVVKWASFYRPDNLQIDANGNIKNVKQNEETANDIPASNSVNQLNQFANKQETKQEESKQILVDSPISTNETAPQIAAKVSETISSTTPEQTVSDIMARLMKK